MTPSTQHTASGYYACKHVTEAFAGAYGVAGGEEEVGAERLPAADGLGCDAGGDHLPILSARHPSQPQALLVP